MDGGIEGLLAHEEAPSNVPAPRASRVLVVIGAVAVAYGVVVGAISATLLDIAPYSKDPDGYKGVGVGLLWPLGDVAYWIGVLVRAAVATLAGDGIGLVVAWIVFAIVAVAIALTQAVLLGGLVAGSIRAVAMFAQRRVS